MSLHENQLSELQKLGSQIHPTLLEDEIPLLNSEVEDLKKRLNKVLNLADKTITEVEIDCIVWSEYRDLFEKVADILRTPVPEEKPASISAMTASIKKLSHHAQEMQKNQRLIDDLNEKARSLNRRANIASSDVIDRQMSNINSQWQEQANSLESRVSALTDILNQWEIYSEVDKNMQTSLLGYERRLEDLVSSQHVNEDALKVSFFFRVLERYIISEV